VRGDASGLRGREEDGERPRGSRGRAGSAGRLSEQGEGGTRGRARGHFHLEPPPLQACSQRGPGRGRFHRRGFSGRGRMCVFSALSACGSSSSERTGGGGRAGGAPGRGRRGGARHPDDARGRGLRGAEGSAPGRAGGRCGMTAWPWVASSRSSSSDTCTVASRSWVLRRAVSRWGRRTTLLLRPHGGGGRREALREGGGVLSSSDSSARAARAGAAGGRGRGGLGRGRAAVGAARRERPGRWSGLLLEALLQVCRACAVLGVRLAALAVLERGAHARHRLAWWKEGGGGTP
jgi:hypothetical protein